MLKKSVCVLLSIVLIGGLLGTSFGPVSAAPVTHGSGDVNADGFLDSADARLILRHAAGTVTLNETQLAAADITGNGVVNRKDADALWKLIFVADKTSAALTGTTTAPESSEVSSEESETPHSAADRTTAVTSSTTARRTTSTTAATKKTTTTAKTTKATTM